VRLLEDAILESLAACESAERGRHPLPRSVPVFDRQNSSP
jgi:hypothetical protein